MKRILLLLALVLVAGVVSSCRQQKAQDTIIRYCMDRPDEFPGYEPVSFDEISQTYSNPDYIPRERDASGEEEVLLTPPRDPSELKHDGWMTRHRFKVQNPDGVTELCEKVFCLDLTLTRVTRVSDRW